MKNLVIKALSVATLLSISATALAYQDTDYFKIGHLEASSDSRNGYRVYPASGYALPTNQGCAKTDFAEMAGITDASVTEAVIMNNTLLAAFMAARKVKLRLDGCGHTGRPKYRIVSLEFTQ